MRTADEDIKRITEMGISLDAVGDYLIKHPELLPLCRDIFEDDTLKQMKEAILVVMKFYGKPMTELQIYTLLRVFWATAIGMSGVGEVDDLS